MRVAVISESFLPTVNGVTGSVCKVLEHLRERGDEAIVIAPAAGAPTEYAGFPVHEVPALAYRQFPVGLPSPIVQRILSDFQPDVLHAASPFLLGAHGIWAANRLGVPSVAVFQTDVPGYARRNGMKAAVKLAWRIVRWVHEGAELTLVPSSASQADLERAGIQRLARWGRGVDLDRYHPRGRETDAARALRARLAPNGELVVGYVGRVAPEKQLERLAKLRGVKGIRIAIVGDGPAMPAVQHALRGLPVSFLGMLRGEELAAAYGAMDVFVHTGDEETFGQTIQEAHAAGLPVVAPRAGGPIDLVHPAVDGFLFEPGDLGQLRDAVQVLARQPELRARMGEAGRRAVLGRSWQAIGEELVGHYETAMRSRALSPGSPLARQALTAQRDRQLAD